MVILIVGKWRLFYTGPKQKLKEYRSYGISWTRFIVYIQILYSLNIYTDITKISNQILNGFGNNIHYKYLDLLTMIKIA